MPSFPDEALADVVAGLTPETVDALVTALRHGEISLQSSSVGISAVHGVRPDAARRTASAFQQLSAETDPATIALALSTANRMRARERLSRPEIEIVWTGPQASGTIMRPTAA